jgi:adenylate cyclase
MAHGLAERERELEIFGRLVSPEVRETLLDGNLQLGGETRWAAVLFSDIRGFSTLSERMDPQNVVALLNEYLTEMTAAAAPFNGYVNNFIGDAIVVIFGAPVPQPDAEWRAVMAALAMRDALAALNVRRAARGDAPLETGIGIAAGDLVAGQIGSPERMLYTVIGDVVNVAARLETLTKEYPGKSILVTDRVASALDQKAVAAHTEPLGPIRLKGRTAPVDVFAVLR